MGIRNKKGQFVKGFKMPQVIREKIRKSKVGKRFAPHYEFKKGHMPWNYRGEIIDKSTGYVLLYKPNYSSPKRMGIYIYRAVYLMEKKLGRYLKKEELIHHINGIRADDRLKNLYLFSSKKTHMDYESKVNATYRKWIQQDYNLN